MKKLIFTFLTMALFLGQLCAQNAFTEGNIVVCRIGNGTETLVETGNTVWLDEYDVSTTPATLIQSLQVKSGEELLTYGGLQTYGGYLNRSSDNLNLTMSGFTGNAPTIAVIDGNANIDLSSKFDASLGTIRSATTPNGNDIWFTTGTSNFSGGIFYAKKGTSAPTRLIDEIAGLNFSSISIIDGVLFINNERHYVSPDYTKSSLWYQSNLVKKLTSSWNTTITSYITTSTEFMMTGNFPSATNNFYRSTTYIADTTSSKRGIVKYARNSADGYPSSKVGNIGVGEGQYFGITEYSADDATETVVFYATRRSTTGSFEIIRVTDIGGYSSAPNAKIEIVATAPVGTVFRGMSLAPKGGVHKAEQTIALNDLALTDNSADTLLPATSEQGLDLTYSSLDNSVVSINGSTLHVEGLGTTQIIAFNLGNDIYKTITDTINVTVTKFTLPIQSISNFNDTTVVYGESITFAATAPGGDVSYKSDDTQVATISGSILTGVSTGIVTVTAMQDGGGNYQSTATTIKVTVIKADQVFTSFEDITGTFGDPDTVINPMVTNGEEITYVSRNNSVATVSGTGMIHLAGAGSTYIVATQAGNSNFNEAVDSILITVGKASQIISNFSDITKTYGDGNFALVAMTTSGLDIIYEVADPLVAIVSGNAVKIMGAGTTTITASQPGNNNYEAADFTITLTVAKAAQSISNFDNISKTYGDAVFDLSATATSGLPVTYAIAYDTVATISGSAVNIVEAGTTTITASQAGNANYGAVDSTITLTIAKATQTISGLADITKTVGDANFDLAATASSGQPVTYAIADTTIATISGSTLSIEGAGTTTITASQAGNNNYEAATDVTATLTVNSQTKQNQDIDNFADVTVTFGDPGFDLLANASSGLDITYTVQYDTIVSISSNMVTILGAGTTTITASQAGNDTYNPVSKSITLTVNKATQDISDFTDITKRPDDADFDLTATASSGLEVSYNIADENVATVSNGTVHIVAKGTTTITASQSGNNNYEAAQPVVITLTVDFPSAVNEMEESGAAMVIYPNPVTNGELTVEYPNAGKKALIKITTITGKQVMIQNVAPNSSRITLPVRGFTSGIYFVAFSDENRQVIKKLIVR